MKRCRLSYDEWKCIVSKNITGKRVQEDFFQGYIGLIEIIVLKPRKNGSTQELPNTDACSASCMAEGWTRLSQYAGSKKDGGDRIEKASLMWYNSICSSN